MTDDNMRINVSMTREDARQMLYLLNRALNTLEPKYWPEWANDLTNKLHAFSHAKTEPKK